MKTVYTCNSGKSLIEMGATFGAWNRAGMELGEVIVQVEEGAITMESDEGEEYRSYVIDPLLGEVKIIGTVTAEYIEKIMVDSDSI